MAQYRKSEKFKEYMREYKARPGVRERMRATQREHMAKHYDRPDRVQYRKEYNARPHVRVARRRGSREANEKIREAVINIYSNGEACCNICRIADLDVLCLDHIANDGKEHRDYLRSMYGGGVSQICRMIRKLDYPPGFQVLCFNCNMKKEIARRRNNRT
jgi:hypothetical protein